MKYSKSIRTQLLLAITITFFVFLLVTMGGVYLFQKDALTRESIKKVTELDSVLKAGFKSQMLTHDTALTQTMVNEVGALKISSIYSSSTPMALLNFLLIQSTLARYFVKTATNAGNAIMMQRGEII